MISIINLEDGKFFSVPGCITWFTDDRSKVKVYKDEFCEEFLRDERTLDRSSLYGKIWDIANVPEETMKLKPKIYDTRIARDF